MSIAANIPQAILDTILGRLALLFLAGAAGDLSTARDAASQMLAAYNVATEQELSLAAEIISFGFHTLEALSYASSTDLSLNQVLRLRGGAVSLSREQHKAQRKLDQLQRARRAGIPAEAIAAQTEPTSPQATPSRPKVDNALDLIEAAREVMQAVAKTGGKSWTQSFQKRQTAKRIAKNLKKNQAQYVNQAAHLDGALADGSA